MTEPAGPALGLSIGATSLAAVTADHAVIRRPVLTLYRRRPPEVGVPSENPRLDRRGLVFTDFVDRVGDPVEIVAADGSMHLSEELVAESLRALGYAVTGAHALPDDVAVTYPVHWGSVAVDALGAALSRVVEWSDRAHPLTLIPDAAAMLFAARANPGLPAHGTVLVCDFGGSGTSITLMDAAGNHHPLAPTLRYPDFSGNLIDQLLLTAVMATMPSTGPFNPSATSAIGALSRLRTGCRNAKEQLSSTMVATPTDGLPGTRGDVRVTRDELDDAIRAPLDNLLTVIDETLVRNGIRDLTTVLSVGGGANIPAVTTALSGHFRVPVITTPRPQLAAAVGGALRAVHDPVEPGAAVLTPSVAEPASVAPVEPWPPPIAMAEAAATGPALGLMSAPARSESDDSRAVPATAAGEYPQPGPGYPENNGAHPELSFEQPAPPRPEPKAKNLRWYRRPVVIAIGTGVAVLVGTAVAIGLSFDDDPAPGAGTSPASPAPPANVAPASPALPPPAAVTQEAPPPSAIESNPPAADAPLNPAADAPLNPAADAPLNTVPPLNTLPPVVPEAPSPEAQAPPAPVAPAVP